jgi:hypothetical protein
LRYTSHPLGDFEILNQGEKIDLGSTLSKCKDFTMSFHPSLKGIAILSSEPIK